MGGNMTPICAILISMTWTDVQTLQLLMESFPCFPVAYVCPRHPMCP